MDISYRDDVTTLLLLGVSFMITKPNGPIQICTYSSCHRRLSVVLLRVNVADLRHAKKVSVSILELNNHKVACKYFALKCVLFTTNSAKTDISLNGNI